MPIRGPDNEGDARKVRVEVSTPKKVSVPALSGEQSLNRYLSEIKKFPMLTPEQEYMLAKRYAEHEDPEAAAQLVTSHLRLVAKIAMGYRGYGLPVSDLISEGNVGLMQGVKKFEPDRGFRLATYAMWWIKASIQEFILRSWSLVKMGTTAAQKKLFFNLRRMKKELEAYEDGDLHPDDVTKIATDLGVPEQEVINMNRRMMMGGDGSLNVSMRNGEEGAASGRTGCRTTARCRTKPSPRPKKRWCATRCWSRRWAASTSARSTSSPSGGWSITRRRSRS